MKPGLRKWLPVLAAGPAAIVPLTVQALLIGSVGLGLLFLVLPALGYFPALGARNFDFAPLRQALGYPGLVPAITATLVSGGCATLVSLFLALGLVAALDPLGAGDRPAGRWLRRAMLALIATPHLAVAIGLGFLLAPSGWLIRIAARALPIDQPPDYLLVNDRHGFALALALVIKETPFLLAVSLSSLHRIDVAAQLRVCRTLGYAPAVAWLKIVLPQVYRLIRLPVFAVLAYGLSVADMSIILGPTLPPTLPVLILRLVADPDLGSRMTAAGAGVLQLGLVLAAFLIWRLGEAAFARVWHRAIGAGKRDFPKDLQRGLRGLLLAVGAVVIALGLGAVAAVALWSIAEAWRFPSLLPQAFSLATWQRVLGATARPVADSLAIAAAAAGIAVAASIACLELEDRIGAARGRRGQWVLFLPLFAPEMGFLFGLEVATSTVGFSGTAAAVLWFHLLFVFPYVFLTLSEPWRALDPRFARTARCLGAGRWRVLLRVKAPLLRAPLALGLAVGLAVSLTLYLPTVLAGAGRVTTLATETVALYGSGDRRVLGVYALLQTGLALAIFAAAVFCGRPRRFSQEMPARP